MAETVSKRQREDPLQDELETDPKRHKSYTHILSILEDEEDDDSDQDPSDILTALQQELCSSSHSSTATSNASLPSPPVEYDPDQQTSLSDFPRPHAISDEGDEEREKVIRHLLEASDDELGIPRANEGCDEETVTGDEYPLSVCDGLWEFEDEAANYNTLLQSELFM